MKGRRNEERAIRRWVGAEIKRRSASLGIVPARLAEAAEVDDRQMARVFEGKAGLSLYSLKRVATALGCTPGEIYDAALARHRAGAARASTPADGHAK